MAPRSTYICLSSTSSLKLFPKNTNTSFTNSLPHPIVNTEFKKFHIQMVGIGIVPRLSLRNYMQGGKTTGYLKVHINELEAQKQGRQTTRTAGGFTFPPEHSWDKYSYSSFKHAPQLPLRFQQLNSLHVNITDLNDRPVDLGPGFETIVWAKMMDESDEDQFTITCLSRQPNLYPQNTLTQFISPLMSSLHLPNYEVALLNVVFPPRLAHKATKATLQLDEVKLEFVLNHYNSTEQFIAAVSAAVTGSVYGDQLHFRKAISPKYRGQVYLGREPGAGDIPIRVITSPSFTKACGQIDYPRDITFLEQGQFIPFSGKPNIYHALPNPVAMLECDIIEPNVMSGKQAHLLQCVPLPTGGYSKKNTKLFEPEQLAFHRITSSPFNSIGFALKETNGDIKELTSVGRDTNFLTVTLLFRLRK